jgi:hypothetical protein
VITKFGVAAYGVLITWGAAVVVLAQLERKAEVAVARLTRSCDELRRDCAARVAGTPAPPMAPARHGGHRTDHGGARRRSRRGVQPRTHARRPAHREGLAHE